MFGRRIDDYWQGWVDCIDFLQMKYCTGEIPARARELMTNEKNRIKKIIEYGKTDKPDSEVPNGS